MLSSYSTYPKQIGIDPIQLNWGNSDPALRGPVVVSRAPSTIRRRNGWPILLPCLCVATNISVKIQQLEVSFAPPGTSLLYALLTLSQLSMSNIGSYTGDHANCHSGGSYSVYYALAVASKELDLDHRSVLTLAATVAIGWLWLIC